jgi:phage/plasmid-like protein (TIGR03299 family)
MLVAAGLDWRVSLVQLETSDSHQRVDRLAVRRSSDSRILGTVGARYVPLQNETAFEWFDPFVQAGVAAFHTAGSLCEGSRIWVLAKLNRDPMEIVKDDVVEKYLLLSHGHDGTLSVRCGFTPIRVVCNNTLSAAHSSASSQLIRLRHTKSLKTNLDAIRETINTVNARFEATAEQYRRLAHRDINSGDVRRYVKLVLDIRENDADLSARARHVVEAIERNVEMGLGNRLPGVRGTWWAAYNGITEYFSHERGRNADSRLNSLWFGPTATANKKALEKALELAA